MVREALESLYTGVLMVTESVKVRKDNKSTSFEDVVTLEGVPCRLSIKTLSSNNPSDKGHNLRQQIKVFLTPDVVIKPGSRLTITQNNVTRSYKYSGAPMVYSCHQEIILEVDEEYS